MASTIEEIRSEIIAVKEASPVLAGITSDSEVADWLLWAEVFAIVSSDTENYFDQHKADVSEQLNAMKAHTRKWYVNKAKAFQLGYALPQDEDTYAVIDPAAQIITEAAIDELDNQMRLKVATGGVGALGPIGDANLAAFDAYIHLIKDAGVRITCTSNIPDVLIPELVIFYDPLVLDAGGARLDGTSATPVLDGINAFLQMIPFNGTFYRNRFVQYMEENVAGVVMCDIESMTATYDGLPLIDVNMEYKADAGYMRIDVGGDNPPVINYQPHDPLP